jgi:hypothetical protein
MLANGREKRWPSAWHLSVTTVTLSPTTSCDVYLPYCEYNRAKPLQKKIEAIVNRRCAHTASPSQATGAKPRKCCCCLVHVATRSSTQIRYTHAPSDQVDTRTAGSALATSTSRPSRCVNVRDGSSTSSLYHRAHLLHVLHLVQHVTLVLRRGTYL